MTPISACPVRACAGCAARQRVCHGCRRLRTTGVCAAQRRNGGRCWRKGRADSHLRRLCRWPHGEAGLCAVEVGCWGTFSHILTHSFTHSFHSLLSLTPSLTPSLTCVALWLLLLLLLLQVIKASGPVSALAYSPNGALLASGDTNRNVYVFDTSDFSLKMNRWRFHTARINDLAWHPNSELLARCVLPFPSCLWLAIGCCFDKQLQ